jgi:glutathione S-transferase
MYRNSGKQHDKPLLWGAPGSLWTGRTRAYFIKKGIDYQEIFPSHARFMTEIVPLVGYFAIPVTELEDGTLIQDGTDTMVHMEQRFPERPMIPSSPVQQGVAWLIEFFGCDLFFIPAMHYRWNFPEQQDFLDAEFARSISPSKDPQEQKAAVAPIREFFAGFPASMGVNENTIPAIEASHIECLEILNQHFLHHPYLLGGHPSLADFGLIGPLFAHLGRDPVPASLMKNIAPHVYRWTERMFEVNLKDGEFMDDDYEFPPDDALPETLIPFIEYLFRDCGPQVQGMLDTFNDWVACEPERPAGSLVQTDPTAPPGAHPQLGNFDFELRGVALHSQAFSNVVHHFQRVVDVIDALDENGKAAFNSLLEHTGGASLMSTKLTRRIKTENYCFMLE